MARSLGKVLDRAEKRSQKRIKWLKQIDVLDFLERLDIDNIHQATRTEIQFSCPFDGHAAGDSTPSAYMNTGEIDKAKTTVWKCHGCGRFGNAISFYSEYAGVSKTEATTHVRREFAGDYKSPKGGSISAEFEHERAQLEVKSEDHVEIIPLEDYNDRFGVDWFKARLRYRISDDCPMYIAYLFDRGFHASTLSYWKIGYDELSQRLVIPVSDPHGNIVGIKGRTWRPRVKPKYMVLGDKPGRRTRYGFRPFEKSWQVFGLPVAQDRPTILVEGELDVIALWQAGICAVSTGSAHLSARQAVLIRDYCSSVIVFFDSNPAGDNATFGYYNKDGEWKPGIVEKLEPFMSVKIVEEHNDDAADMVKEGRVDELNKLIAEATSSKLLLRE